MGCEINNVPLELKEGMLVADVLFMHCIFPKNYWYTESDKKGLVMIQYAFCSDVKLVSPSSKYKFPKKSHSNIEYDALKLKYMTIKQHSTISDVINRRESIDIEEEIYDDSDTLDSSSGNNSDESMLM